jgi:hypothetical protein
MNNSESKAGGLDLLVEEGNAITVSVESKSYSPFILQVHPRSTKELREFVGVSLRAESIEVSRDNCCLPSSLQESIPSVEDLEHRDPEIQKRASRKVRDALQLIVQGQDSAVLRLYESVTDRFLEKTRAVISIARLRDIEVRNRGVLVFAPNIHAVSARDIRLYGSGRLDCKGPKTIRARSMEGKIGFWAKREIASAAAAGIALTHV